MTTSPAPLTSEAEFIAAEREIARLHRERKRHSGGSDEANKSYNGRIDALYDSIASSPPTSPASAAVKLRLLTHPDLGIEMDTGSAQDFEGLRQVASFLSLSQSREVEDDTLDNARHELKQLYDELVKVEGVALCLIDLTEYISPHSGHEKFRYLGARPKEHCTAALNAVEKIEEAGGAA
jgi:hypothetical protein